MLLPCGSSSSLRELEEYEDIFNPDLLFTLDSVITFESYLE